MVSTPHLLSCSLTVRNQEEQRLRRTSYEVRTEDLPTCEERQTLIVFSLLNRQKCQPYYF